jgi:hypothetical protein
MPRDVRLGEGYDGGTQLASHAPGHHNGEFWLDDGSSTLMHVGDIPDQGYSGVANFDRQQWAMGEMGTFTELLTNLIASGKLDQLRSAVGQLSDLATKASNMQNPLFNGYVEAKAIRDSMAQKYGLTIPIPFGGMMPNPVVIPSLLAYSTAVEAVKVLARLRDQVSQTAQVYTVLARTLREKSLPQTAGEIEAQVSSAMRIVQGLDAKFIGPSGQRAAGIVPEYGQTLIKIAGAAQSEWSAWGVGLGNYDDPRWMEAYIKAANKVVPIPESATKSAGLSGLGSLGAADPISWTLIIIAAIKIIAALVVILAALDRMVPDQNLKAREAAKIAQKAFDAKVAEEARMRAQGKTQEEIDRMKAGIDADAKKSVATIPDPKGFLEGVLGPLGLVAAAIVAGVVLNK